MVAISCIVNALWSLAYMYVNSFPLLLLCVGDIDVIGRFKAHRLRSRTRFNKIQFKLATATHPGLYRQEAGSLVVLMRVNRPMCKHDGRVFFFDKAFYFIHPFIVDNTITVDLSGENRFCSQYLASGNRFFGPDCSSFFM